MGAKGKRFDGLALPRDTSGETINAGRNIIDILNATVTSDDWTAICLSRSGEKMACKSISAGMRDGSNWKLSHLFDGESYRTVRGTIALDIVKERGERLFFVQASSGTGTLEVILLD